MWSEKNLCIYIKMMDDDEVSADMWKEVDGDDGEDDESITLGSPEQETPAEAARTKRRRTRAARKKKKRVTQEKASKKVSGLGVDADWMQSDLEASVADLGPSQEWLGKVKGDPKAEAEIYNEALMVIAGVGSESRGTEWTGRAKRAGKGAAGIATKGVSSILTRGPDLHDFPMVSVLFKKILQDITALKKVMKAKGEVHRSLAKVGAEGTEALETLAAANEAGAHQQILLAQADLGNSDMGGGGHKYRINKKTRKKRHKTKRHKTKRHKTKIHKTKRKSRSKRR